jgi:hypothetical protein
MLRITDIEPKPGSVAKVQSSITNICVIKIDECVGHAVEKYAIAWAWIAVAHNLIDAGALKICGGVMERT